ncbi:hypothetical protein EDD17DRAFT_1506444 [Pisolithus thermaeus]|nr:hypothetical protein EV401DRAFT_1887611 [Pisolithus croceorrhizus]KAI6164435.1 hypothetical protein EDD17DRAFT_1506444 [Pisolithus thermaeus]
MVLRQPKIVFWPKAEISNCSHLRPTWHDSVYGTTELANMNPSYPTNATQAKGKLYGQLAASFKNMSRAVGQTADLFEQLQADLDAMRVLAGTHAAQFMTVAAELIPESAEDGASEPQSDG